MIDLLNKKIGDKLYKFATHNSVTIITIYTITSISGLREFTANICYISYQNGESSIGCDNEITDCYLYANDYYDSISVLIEDMNKSINSYKLNLELINEDTLSGNR